MVEVDGGSNLQGRDRDHHLDENTYVEGKNFLDFSLERSRSGADGAHDRKRRAGGGGGRGEGGDVLHAHGDSDAVDVMDGIEGERRARELGGDEASNTAQMDVLSQLLQKGRQMLNRLDRLAQQEDEHSSQSVAQDHSMQLPPTATGARASCDASSLLLSTAMEGKVSRSLEEELGSSLLMSDFEEVRADRYAPGSESYSTAIMLNVNQSA